MTMAQNSQQAYIQTLERQVLESAKQYNIYKTRYEQLEKEKQQLENENLRIVNEKQLLELKNIQLKEQLRLALYRKFRRGTEIFKDNPLLFDSAEIGAPVAPETAAEN
jgi:rRNA pseudouridine-1189 N-methylase Emg1 (Nep1/Mra1 family)